MSAGFPARARRADLITESQAVVVGANIRLLRQRKGWNQAKLGELMGWHASTVCAAERRRSEWQRSFTTAEVERLASIFGVLPCALTAGGENCGEHPPPELACPACGARTYGAVAPSADDGRELRVLTLLATIDEQLEEARRLLTRR